MIRTIRAMLGYIRDLQAFHKAMTNLEVKVENYNGTAGTGSLAIGEGKAVLIIKLNS